jgi:GNAT superfamily N-acetyltransferase
MDAVDRVQVTSHPRLLAQAAALRHRVFVDGQGVPAELERDGLDPACWHAVALDAQGRVQATGRLLDAGDHARVARVAVRPDARGGGVGASVLAALEELARLQGLPRVRLHAQLPVTGFYARLGYRPVGEPDWEAGLEHRWMERELLPGLRPVTDADAADIQQLIGGCFQEYPGCVLDLASLDEWMTAPATKRGDLGGLWVVPAASGPAASGLAASGLAACGGWGPVEEPGGPAGVELKSLYVAAPARRAGYGRALVGLVERTARQLGAPWVQLWTDSRFVQAHRLYEDLGYLRLPQTRRLHDPSDTTELFYRKAVQPGR